MHKPAVPYEDVRGAFSAIAPEFESSLENSTTASFREELYRIISTVIRPGDSVLDVNCGTGIDALALAARGFRVTGVDISPGMLREAGKKAASRPELGLEFLESSFDDLSAVAGRTFDLVMSNFGGLNCTATPWEAIERMAAVTKPDGYVLAVIMPRTSIWEIVAGLVRFNLRAAFRRMRTSAPSTGFRDWTFPVFYFSLRTMLRRTSRWLRTRRIRGVWIVSPPPHAESFRRRFPRMSVVLAWIDGKIAGFPLVRALGDHVMILFQRVPGDAPEAMSRRKGGESRPWIEMVSGECRRLATGATSWDDDPEFARLLSGKRVVVAGPARTLTGKGLGSFIDSFDVVVRLNESFEWIRENPNAWADYGSRTDLLYCNQSILKQTMLADGGIGSLASLCRSGELSRIVCTNNSLDFDQLGNPSPKCAGVDKDTIHRVNAALRTAGVNTPVRVVRSASEWSIRMLRGHWGRTGFIAIVDLLGFSLAHLAVTGMTLYHGGGHVLAEGPELHPLGNRNGTKARGPGGGGHDSFLEADVFRLLYASSSGRISVDDAFSRILAMTSDRSAE